MLFLPDSLNERLEKVGQEIEDQHLDSREAARRLLAVDPDYAPAFRMLGNAALDAGDRAEAERLLWRAIELEPFGSLNYVSLAGLYRNAPETADAAKQLLSLALWTVAMSEDVAPEISRGFREFASPEMDSEDPYTYCVLAASMEQELKSLDIPEALRARIHPYLLLNQLARGAADILPRETLDCIRAEVSLCVPVWRAALRSWAREDTEINTQILAMIMALLGEFAGPDVLEELWELADFRDPEIFLHANWALYRMAQRFPAEALASVRAAIPNAGASLRCAIGEHLGMMKRTQAVEPALLELVKDFPRFKNDPNGAYLLAVTANALTQAGHPERSAELLAKYERLLDKDGRRWMREEFDGPEGFVPRFVEEDLADLDIEDICLSQALLDDNDAGEFDDEEDFDDEDDFEDFDRTLPKPGRNDPCWCGSGKKYKKCHLTSDEEAARRPVQDSDEDPVRTDAMGGLLATADRLHKRRDQIEAARQYFGDDLDESKMEEESEGFVFWYLFNFRPESTQRTAVEEHLRKNDSRLTPEVRAMLEAWRDSRYGLFEIAEIPEDGLELTDLLSGGHVLVNDPSSAGELRIGDAILARLETYRDTVAFSETPLFVEECDLPALQRFIDAESVTAGQTPAEFVQTNSHRLHRVLEDL